LEGFPESEWLKRALNKVWPQILEEMKQIGQLDTLEARGEAAKEAINFLSDIGLS
jgi:hypothetical protein